MSELLEGLLPWHVSSINELLAVYHAGALASGNHDLRAKS